MIYQSNTDKKLYYTETNIPTAQDIKITYIDNEGTELTINEKDTYLDDSKNNAQKMKRTSDNAYVNVWAGDKHLIGTGNQPSQGNPFNVSYEFTNLNLTAFTLSSTSVDVAEAYVASDKILDPTAQIDSEGQAYYKNSTAIKNILGLVNQFFDNLTYKEGQTQDDLIDSISWDYDWTDENGQNYLQFLSNEYAMVATVSTDSDQKYYSWTVMRKLQESAPYVDLDDYWFVSMIVEEAETDDKSIMTGNVVVYSAELPYQVMKFGPGYESEMHYILIPLATDDTKSQMTWNEFVQSEYNTGDNVLRIEDGKVYITLSDADSYMTEDDGTTPIDPSSVIQSNTSNEAAMVSYKLYLQ